MIKLILPNYFLLTIRIYLLVNLRVAKYLHHGVVVRHLAHLVTKVLQPQLFPSFIINFFINCLDLRRRRFLIVFLLTDADKVRIQQARFANQINLFVARVWLLS